MKDKIHTGHIGWSLDYKASNHKMSLDRLTSSVPEMVDFNINYYVHVRLTPYGRECLRNNYDELRACHWDKLPYEFSIPEENEEGWSRWQMHTLIEQFGKYVGVGLDLPFETTIRIEISK